MERNDEIRPRLLSEDEGAKYLGISKWMLRDLVHRGEIPRVPIGRRVLVDRQDLDAYLERIKIHHGS